MLLVNQMCLCLCLKNLIFSEKNIAHVHSYINETDVNACWILRFLQIHCIACYNVFCLCQFAWGVMLQFYVPVNCTVLYLFVYPDLVVLTLWEMQMIILVTSLAHVIVWYLVLFAFEFCCKPIPYGIQLCWGDQEQSICELHCSLATLDRNYAQLIIVPMPPCKYLGAVW